MITQQAVCTLTADSDDEYAEMVLSIEQNKLPLGATITEIPDAKQVVIMMTGIYNLPQ